MQTTAEPKKAKKPEGALENIKAEQGRERAPEVIGHAAVGAYYICAYCLAVNWVANANCDWFVCWSCGHLNGC